MARRARLNPRLAKIHLSYRIDEAAELFGVHRNTIRNWIKQGLPVVDDLRPTLILGRELRRFIEGRRKSRSVKCPPGTLYCVRCRAPRRPAADMADCIRLTPTTGDLRGICPACETIMHRRVNLTRLDKVCAGLDVCVSQAESHLRESPAPSLDCHFVQEPRCDEDSQP